MAALYAPSPVSPTSPIAASPASPTSPPSPTRKAPSPPRHQTPPTPSTPSTGLPQLPFSHSTASLDSPSSGYSRTHSRTPSKVSLTSSIDMRHKDNTIFEHPPSLNLTFPQRSTSHTQLGLSGEEIHNLKFGQRTSSHTQLDLSGEEIHNLKFGQRTSSHTQLDLSSEELNNLKFGQRTTSHMKLKLKHDAKDVEQPLFSPGLNRSFTTHQAQVTQSPQMGVIAGESPRSSRASSHSGDDRDSPESRHSSSDSSSSRRGQSRFEALAENHNSPYLPPSSQQSASPASSQEGISNSRFLAAPGVNYRRSPRPSSVYSSYSDIRGGSPRQHSRAVSAHSYEGHRASHTELPHMQPPPPVLTGNSHLKGVIGTNASLLSTKQTLEMYRANAKKTNDPILQYELAIFMVNAAQQQEILASEGGRAPKRDLDSPYVDTSAQQSKAELLKEARSILEKLGNKLPQAQYYLADAYASGLFTNGKIENEKAFPLFVAASKRGYAEAGYRTALCYEFGWGCRADPAKAVQYYRQSASKNHPGAMTRLGKACLKDDLGLSGRYKEGVKWLRRATDVADHQYPNAPYELGLLYEMGFGDDIFQDLDYAAQLFTQAAELGHVDAFYRMGDAYEHGKLNCPRNAALSVHFYTGAAQGGHLLAMMALCAWYMVGAEPVLEKNEDEAYQWALKAAESGLAKAEYAVGYFTEMGIGCRRDLLEANVWYVKAADHGDKRAKDRLAVIQAAAAGSTTDKKNKKKGKGRDSPSKLEGRRPSGDKECSIM